VARSRIWPHRSMQQLSACGGELPHQWISYVRLVLFDSRGRTEWRPMVAWRLRRLDYLAKPYILKQDNSAVGIPLSPQPFKEVGRDLV